MARYSLFVLKVPLNTDQSTITNVVGRDVKRSSNFRTSFWLFVFKFECRKFDIHL